MFLFIIETDEVINLALRCLQPKSKQRFLMPKLKEKLGDNVGILVYRKSVKASLSYKYFNQSIVYRKMLEQTVLRPNQRKCIFASATIHYRNVIQGFDEHKVVSKTNQVQKQKTETLSLRTRRRRRDTLRLRRDIFPTRNKIVVGENPKKIVVGKNNAMLLTQRIYYKRYIMLFLWV